MSFLKSKLKGIPFEEQTYIYLKTVCKEHQYTIKRVHEVLGEKIYRKNNLKYPDFTIQKENIVVLIDAKEKAGSTNKKTKKLRVSMDESFVKDYKELSKQENSKMLVYLKCTTNQKIYRIDINKLPKYSIERGSPLFGKKLVYFFNVEDLKEINYNT